MNEPTRRHHATIAASRVLQVSWCFLAIGMSASAAFGAGGSKGKHVCRPIEVEGVVATIDDVVYDPYVGFVSATIAEGDSRGLALFDIPEGMRLVIETISIYASAPNGQAVEARIQMTAGGGLRTVCVPSLRASPGVAPGEEAHVGTHPIKLRLDYQPGVIDELQVDVRRGSQTGDVLMAVSIAGYLVDI
jgi:hypothetical protein